MEFNLTTLGILVAVWVVGYLLGLLESAIKNSNKEEKGDDVVLMEDGEETEASMLAPDTLDSKALVIYERLSGALKLRLDGEVVEYKSDITTKQRGRLLSLVVSLRPWLDAAKEKKPLAPLPAGAKIPTTPPDVEIETDEVAQQMEFAKLNMVEQIDRILDNHHIDLVQLPVNILDQRLIDGGQLKRLKKHGVEIHVRSAFLQGLLLMKTESISSWFDPIRGALEDFHAKARKLNMSTLQLALGFVQSINEVDKVVVGVNTLGQLHEIINSVSVYVNTEEFSDLSVSDPIYLNPSNWKK